MNFLSVCDDLGSGKRLDKVLSKAHALESSETQESGMENSREQVSGGERVNWVMPKNPRQPPPREDANVSQHGHK